jgi:hypothetical protein
LNKEDQEAFDRLFDRVKKHTSAGVYLAHPWPMEITLLSIYQKHGKMIEEIRAKLRLKTEGMLFPPAATVPFLCIFHGCSWTALGVGWKNPRETL